MKIYDVLTPSPEWHWLRMQRPTASEFNRIMTSKCKLSDQAHGYVKELVENRTCEYLPERAELYLTRPMKLGLAREAESLRWFEMDTGYRVVKAGFITTDCGRFGASPDGFVMDGERVVAGIECKCTLMKTHAKWIDKNECPVQHLQQCHGGIICSGGLPWYFVSYPPPAKSEYEYLPPLRVRIDPNGFTDELRVRLEQFDAMFQSALDQAKRL